MPGKIFQDHDMADTQRKQARILYKFGRMISNVTNSPTDIQSITIECLVVVGRIDRKFGTGFADLDADTSVKITYWFHLSKSSNGFSPIFPMPVRVPNLLELSIIFNIYIQL